MIHQITLPGADVRVVERLVNLERPRLYPFAIIVVPTFLSDFADVDFRIEIGGKSLVMVTRIAVHNVKVVNFVKMVFGRISGINAADPRVETAAQNGGESRFFEFILIGPLPAVFKVSHIFRLIIGGVEVVDSTLQTGIHDGKVLIGQCHIDD